MTTHRRKPIVQLTMDPLLLAKIDALAPRGGRSRWIEDACRAALAAKVLPIPGFEHELCPDEIEVD